MHLDCLSLSLPHHSWTKHFLPIVPSVFATFFSHSREGGCELLYSTAMYHFFWQKVVYPDHSEQGVPCELKELSLATFKDLTVMTFS